MLRWLSLLAPVLFPSWRFFAWIAPAPRVEFGFSPDEAQPPQHWQAFRPTPQHLSAWAMARRLLWNPHWNETLFLSTRAERLVETDSDEALAPLLAHIGADHAKQIAETPQAENWLHVRILVVTREAERLVRTEARRFVVPAPSHIPQTSHEL